MYITCTLYVYSVKILYLKFIKKVGAQDCKFAEIVDTNNLGF